MMTSVTKKNGILATTFHKTVGKSNAYVWFEYDPHKNFNHTLWKISGSTNSDKVNAIFTSKNQ